MWKWLVILHVLGATIWTGGHLVLSLVVLPGALRQRNPEIIRSFESGFEKIGIPALLLQVLTGLSLTTFWFPGFRGLLSFTTPHSTHITTKLVLLGLTLLLALHARLRLIPHLTAERLPLLAGHIVAVTVISVLFVVVGVGMRFGGVFQ